MDRHVRGSINGEDASRGAKHWRNEVIFIRVEELRQQIDITAAGLRIFVDDDEVAIGKGGNGGIGLRSGLPISQIEVYVEVDLLFSERLKSGSHCHPPICVLSGGSKELGAERSWR